jgi:hypothetical protein
MVCQPWYRQKVFAQELCGSITYSLEFLTKGWPSLEDTNFRLGQDSKVSKSLLLTVDYIYGLLSTNKHSDTKVASQLSDLQKKFEIFRQFFRPGSCEFSLSRLFLLYWSPSLTITPWRGSHLARLEANRPESEPPLLQLQAHGDRKQECAIFSTFELISRIRRRCSQLDVSRDHKTLHFNAVQVSHVWHFVLREQPTFEPVAGARSVYPVHHNYAQGSFHLKRALGRPEPVHANVLQRNIR